MKKHKETKFVSGVSIWNFRNKCYEKFDHPFLKQSLNGRTLSKIFVYNNRNGGN